MEARRNGPMGDQNGVHMPPRRVQMGPWEAKIVMAREPWAAKMQPKSAQVRHQSVPMASSTSSERPTKRFVAQRCLCEALDLFFYRFLRRAYCLRNVFGPNEIVVLLPLDVCNRTLARMAFDFRNLWK